MLDVNKQVEYSGFHVVLENESHLLKLKLMSKMEFELFVFIVNGCTSVRAKILESA